MKEDLQQFLKKSKELSVLYVEDEKILREESFSLFSKLFRSVDVAENGEEGLKLFKSNRYDIVITDIRMPKMDGIKMAREIRKIFPDQKIFILSAMEIIERTVEATNIGVNGIIEKPINLSYFFDILLNSINKNHSKAVPA